MLFRYKTSEKSCYNRVWDLVFRLRTSGNVSCLPQPLWDNKAWILGLKPLNISSPGLGSSVPLRISFAPRWCEGVRILYIRVENMSFISHHHIFSSTTCCLWKYILFVILHIICVLFVLIHIFGNTCFLWSAYFTSYSIF